MFTDPGNIHIWRYTAFGWSAAIETINLPKERHQFGSTKVQGKESRFCYAFSKSIDGLHILTTEETPKCNDSVFP